MPGPRSTSTIDGGAPTRSTRAAVARAALVPVAVGTLIGLLFVGIFLAASLDRRPTDLPIAVTGPAQAVERLTAEVERDAPGAFDLRVAADRRAAVDLIAAAGAAGGLVMGGDTEVLVAGALGPGTAATVQGALTAALTADGPPRITDVVPAVDADRRGLAVFSTAFGVVLGGFLFGVAVAGTAVVLRPALHVAAILGLGVVLGLLTAVVTVVGFDALPAPIGTTALVAGLLAAAVAAGTSAFIRLAGPAGIGLSSLVLLILGNATSGATLPPEFLPAWLRWFHPVLPAGPAVDALRGAAYFGGANLIRGLLVLALWVVVGSAVVLLVRPRARPARA